MILYGLKACDTCRAASKALGVPITDVRDTPLDAAQIARFLQVLGPDLVNTRSTTWRGLDETARARPAADLLAAHPALMKRPVIAKGDALYLGWGAATKAALL